MKLEEVKLTNFRCFGGATTTLRVDDGTTAFIGANGSGKTAVMLALLRMFGITADSRRVRRQDFHVPSDELAKPSERKLSLEAIFAFPELGADGAQTRAVPAFFREMATGEEGNLKVRIRLDATLTDDGLEGVVDDRMVAIKTLEDTYDEKQCAKVYPGNRSQIQFVYVPAVRDALSHIAALLRGRLWKAIKWSEGLSTELGTSGEKLNTAFRRETGVSTILSSLTGRWQQVHGGGTHAQPILLPINPKLDEFVQGVDVVFHPDETGRDRAVDELSDGQKSLFCLSLVAATLDIENKIRAKAEGFLQASAPLPAMTLIGVEEPENNLAPYYLSRIVYQLGELADGASTQALISSHSASVLSRIDPAQIRYFRFDSSAGTACTREIELPSDDDAGKYVREAVRAYPELYFASFVILGEGSSEEIVLPKIAEFLGTPIDRSFIAIVPLGGRHVNHMWKLLEGLSIPYATLLDLDRGRHGGGADRLKYITDELLARGEAYEAVFKDDLTRASLEGDERNTKDTLDRWCTHLEAFRVYYSSPLDIDMSMLTSFPEVYQQQAGPEGPSTAGDPIKAVLGERGDPEGLQELPFTWYRHLFLGRGKPSTHTAALAELERVPGAVGAPKAIVRLLSQLSREVPPFLSIGQF